VERRYALFIASSLAIVLASQLLQVYFFPKPPVEERIADLAGEPAAADAGDQAANQVKEQPEADAIGSREGGALNGSLQAGDADRVVDAAEGEEADVKAAPRRRLSLGSLDSDSPSQMLVTLTSRGAAVERIELAGGRFFDQDDRSGYLGHLAFEATDQGCRIGVVGAGTPAAQAELSPGDIVVGIGEVAALELDALQAALAKTKPGQKVLIHLLREGRSVSREVTLGHRPLEVVRPEFRTEPLSDANSDVCDPLSFLLSLESRDGKKRLQPLAEIKGQELYDRDWEVDPSADGTGVRFANKLPGGLVIAKEYKLVGLGQPEVKEGDGPSALASAENRQACRLELKVILLSAEKEAKIVYCLDGPTGLPTEGWWYTARVARDWGSLAVRDVAMRFVGEQSTLVSGLKMADESLEQPATAVREGKPLSFAGVDALYFAAALIPAIDDPEAPALAEVRPLVVGDIPVAARRKLTDVTCRLVSREVTLLPGTPVTHRYEIFAGPKKPDLLSRFGATGSSMDDLVYYGWFGWVARPMIAILHAIHAVIGNYGLAILLLTVMVRGAMFPLSRKQAVSAQKMQVLQPEMKAIAEKYKTEPEKRTKATQDLWRKHNYNPAGGCVLVFIQIPIFMGLYRSLATDVELRQASLFGTAIRWCSNLAAPDMFYDWSQLLPAFLTTPEGWLGPFLNLFPLATIGLFLWQQKLFMPPAVDEQGKMQQQVMKYMMFFMALMFFKVPCGLCLYFIASSLWGIAERLLLPTSLATGQAATTGPAPAGRTFDVPFLSVGKRTANGVVANGADANRQKRQARKKR